MAELELPEEITVRLPNSAKSWIYTKERTANRISVGNGEYGHHECSECRSTVNQRDNFCWSCGARLEEE